VGRRASEAEGSDEDVSDTREEIAKLHWKGKCGRCGSEHDRYGNAAYGFVTDKTLVPKHCPKCAWLDWKDYDRSTLEAIESDANLEGLADYIEELRRRAGT
jgi:hypothetical protein